MLILVLVTWTGHLNIPRDFNLKTFNLHNITMMLQVNYFQSSQVLLTTFLQHFRTLPICMSQPKTIFAGKFKFCFKILSQERSTNCTLCEISVLFLLLIAETNLSCF